MNTRPIPKIFVGRYPKQNNGLLTIALGTEYLLRRVPIKTGSGRKQFLDTQWIRGFSPIPLGTFWGHTTPVRRGELPRHGTAGQGYPISSKVSHARYITGETSQQIRQDIQFHMDNDTPGSAGCPVFQVYTDWQKFCTIMDRFNRDGFQFIPVVSFLLKE